MAKVNRYLSGRVLLCPGLCSSHLPVCHSWERIWASCEVNTTTFESTDRPVSTYSLVWEDRPLSNFSHGTGSPTYQPAPLHGSERWFKSGSPLLLATSKSATVSCLRCGVALSPHLSSPVTVIVHFRTVLHFAASKRCHCSDTDPAMHVRKKRIRWFALHVTSNL